jgi:hypothetical protein
MTRVRLAMLGLGLALLMGCERPRADPGPVESAELGVFFGGQVQERDEIPFELDRAKQTVGVRIDFRKPLAHPATVSWEIDMPGSSRRARAIEGRKDQGRVTKLGQARARAGQSRFDHVLFFEPGDPLGVWNFRVQVDDQVVIDRPVLVYSEALRRQALARVDGGV